jgi:AmmeMemoRadiSam system protein B/AmmeMemoRadiSam system protein A
MKKTLFVILIFVIFVFNCTNSPQSKTEGEKMTREQTEKIRKPVVAGAFYPGDPVSLSKKIAGFFTNAKKEGLPGEIVGLIAPHAGYDFSGQVAAYSFKQLEGLDFDVVVVISPYHYDRFSGSSVYNGAAYETPLGKIEVDKELALKINSLSEDVHLSEKGHAMLGIRGEHSLEVELPFLQIVLGDFKLVPIVMGDQSLESCQALGQALAKALKNRNALIVASSDLYHGEGRDEAVKSDRIVIDRVGSFDYQGLYDDVAKGKCMACGSGPIIAAMIAAKGLGADQSKVLHYANSYDVTGDESYVVGYMSAVFLRSENPAKGTSQETERKKVGVDMGLSDKDKKLLKEIARKSIECSVRGEPLPEFKVESGILKEKRGAFVTIEKHGNLRGCIGYIEAVKPLHITIKEMAQAAALKDPRFPPVTSDELRDLELEISVLTPLRRIRDINEIEVGKHGIYMKSGYYSGLLLPQVATDYGWDRLTFLQQTCHKAGMDGDCWKRKETEIYVFSADIF